MQTHLSYATYQKLSEKFGKQKIDTFAYGHVFRGYIENGINFDEFPLINMNGILSKEFIDLIRGDTHWGVVTDSIGHCYYVNGMAAVEYYILSLI